MDKREGGKERGQEKETNDERGKMGIWIDVISESL